MSSAWMRQVLVAAAVVVSSRFRGSPAQSAVGGTSGVTSSATMATWNLNGATLGAQGPAV